MSDTQHLIEQAKNGDINAFHELFSEFQPQLRSYAYRLLTNQQDAEDLTHDVFIKAFDKIATFKENSSLKTWVFAIATHMGIDRLRQHKRWAEDAQEQSREAAIRNPEIVQTYDYINQYSPHGSYEMREHIDFCFTCVSKTLPIEEQIALILKDVYGFKVKEVADILNKSIGVTKHRLHDARKTMMEIFNKRCSLVSKQGVCYQCSELNGRFNPKQDQQVELMRLELVQAAGDSATEALFQLRTKLVQGIDPLNAEGTNLHDFMLQGLRRAIGEID